MEIIPLTLAEANELVRKLHRHHSPVVGSKFCIGASVGDSVVGAAIVGRPVSRMLDDGVTLEITRCVTDGTRNACSMLYGAARRATFALGYRRLITYTLQAESGASLLGAGFKVQGEVKGHEWSRASRPRVEIGGAQVQDKFRWEIQKESPEAGH